MIRILFAIAALLSVVSGKPQHLNLGGIFTPKPVETPNTGGVKFISGKQQDLSGVLKFQLYINSENGPLKIQESDTTFTIPAGLASKCPNDHLFYEPHGKCYLKGSPTPNIDSPCVNDFMVFAAMEAQPVPLYPGRRATDASGFMTRFYESLFWRMEGCLRNKLGSFVYFVLCCFLKGPCKRGEWLVFSNTTQDLICNKRTCPENTLDLTNSFQKSWFEYKGKCYQTETTNEEFCGKGSKNKIYFSVEKPEPVCLERRPVPYGVKGIGGAGALGCRAGQKQLPNGTCKRVVSFE